MASKTSLRRKAKERFAVANKLEREYLHQMRELARHIDHLVRVSVRKDMSVDELNRVSDRLRNLLRQYSNTITPWANNLAKKMVNRIVSVDERAWIQLSKEMGAELRKEINSAPTKEMIDEFNRKQVELITSLPLEAAERVRKMTLEGIIKGTRAETIAEKILETGNVTKSRAKMIARTEVSTTASELTRIRSKHIRSTNYYWRTSEDGSVRESHKKMNGKICSWDDPPEVEPGKHYHAGQYPNCRCYPEPIIDPDLI